MTHGAKRLRVCILTTARLEETAGGLEYFATRLSTSLRAQGHVAVLVHSGLKRPIDYTPNPSSRVYRKTTRRGAEPLLPKLPTMVYFALLLVFSVFATLLTLRLDRTYRFNIVHCQDAGYSGLAGLICARVIRVPLIVHVHGLGFTDVLQTSADTKSAYDRFLGAWDAALQRFVANHASKVVAVSEYVQERLMQLGVSRERLLIIPSGTDLERYRSPPMTDEFARRLLGIPGNSFVIGYVGKLSAGKGVEDLVEAFGRLIKTESIPENSMLVIVGSGTLKQSLLNMLSQNSIEKNVLLAGSRSDVSEILRAFDVFVFPSLFEGRGLSLVEAVAAGRAIVASDIRSVREVIRHEQNGLLVRPGSIAGLEHAILALFKDPELRQRLANEAFRTDLRAFDIGEAVQSVVDVYLSVLS
jgi:glycosyltransferase involved in cell wall biosynthesis